MKVNLLIIGLILILVNGCTPMYNARSEYGEIIFALHWEKVYGAFGQRGFGALEDEIIGLGTTEFNAGEGFVYVYLLDDSYVRYKITDSQGQTFLSQGQYLDDIMAINIGNLSLPKGEYVFELYKEENKQTIKKTFTILNDLNSNTAQINQPNIKDKISNNENEKLFFTSNVDTNTLIPTPRDQFVNSDIIVILCKGYFGKQVHVEITNYKINKMIFNKNILIDKDGFFILGSFDQLEEGFYRAKLVIDEDTEMAYSFSVKGM